MYDRRIGIPADKRPLISWLLQDVGVQAVCVTRDAGDTFTAAMAHQLVRDATPQETLHAANRYAALVATKHGAMPVVSSEELAEIGLIPVARQK